MMMTTAIQNATAMRMPIIDVVDMATVLAPNRDSPNVVESGGAVVVVVVMHSCVVVDDVVVVVVGGEPV